MFFFSTDIFETDAVILYLNIVCAGMVNRLQFDTILVRPEKEALELNEPVFST